MNTDLINDCEDISVALICSIVLVNSKGCHLDLTANPKAQFCTNITTGNNCNSILQKDTPSENALEVFIPEDA
jgi:hypothetical protein